MGVYCDVMMCVGAEHPLDADARARIVELCREHQLLRGPCAVGVPEDVPPRGIGEWLKKHLLSRPPLGKSLGDQVLVPNGGVHFDRGVRSLETRDAGPWLDARARELATDFVIGCDGPFWVDDDSVTQGFRYAALSRPHEVTTSDAYQSKHSRKGRYPGDDGRVGAFWDILSLSAKRNLDGRIASKSAFVRALKKQLGLKVTCRATWW